MATFTGVATGTTTATMPAHAAGHMLFAWAYRDGTAVVPTVPAGWTAIVSGAASSQGAVLCYRLATANNHTTGTFTNASRVVVMVYAPGAGEALGIGKSSQYTGSGTVLYLQPGYDSSGNPAPLTNTDGSSWVLGFAGHRNVNTALETPPAGLTYRGGGVDSTAEAQAFDSNGGLTQWPAGTFDTYASVSAGGTSGNYRTATVEMTVTSGGSPPTSTGTLNETLNTIALVANGVVVATRIAALNKTLSPITGNTTGKVQVTGHTSQALNNATGVSSGFSTTFGALSKPLSNLTGVLSTDIIVTGLTNKTLNAVTGAGTTHLTTFSFLNQPLQNVALISTGYISNNGSLAKTLDSAVTSSQAIVEVVSTGNVAFTDLSVNATVDSLISVYANTPLQSITTEGRGAVDLNGVLNATTESLILSSYTNPIITGGLTAAFDTLVAYASVEQNPQALAEITFEPIQAASTGTIETHASVNTSLALVSAVSTAVVRVAGGIAQVLENIISNASASVDVEADSDITASPLSLSSTVKIGTDGEATSQLGNTTLQSQGAVQLKATTDATLLDITSIATAGTPVNINAAQTLENVSLSSRLSLIDEIVASVDKSFDNTKANSTGITLIEGNSINLLDNLSNTLYTNVSVEGYILKELDTASVISSANIDVDVRSNSQLASMTSLATTNILSRGSVIYELDNCSATGNIASQVTCTSNNIFGYMTSDLKAYIRNSRRQITVVIG